MKIRILYSIKIGIFGGIFTRDLKTAVIITIMLFVIKLLDNCFKITCRYLTLSDVCFVSPKTIDVTTYLFIYRAAVHCQSLSICILDINL